MGDAATQVQSVNFEGHSVERLRIALGAVNAPIDRMLRLSDRGVMYVEFEVLRVEHYGTPLTRRHLLGVVEARIDS